MKGSKHAKEAPFQSPLHQPSLPLQKYFQSQQHASRDPPTKKSRKSPVFGRSVQVEDQVVREVTDEDQCNQHENRQTDQTQGGPDSQDVSAQRVLLSREEWLQLKKQETQQQLQSLVTRH